MALFDAVRGHTDAWVATGAAAASPTPIRVVRLVRVWVLTTQVLLALVLLWRAPQYGWFNYVPIAVFGALNLLIVYPIARNTPELPQLIDPMTIRRQLPGALE